MPRRVVPAPITTLVRAYCSFDHSWVTSAFIVTSWPLGSRHAVQNETLAEPVCSRCGAPYVRFQDTRYGVSP